MRYFSPCMLSHLCWLPRWTVFSYWYLLLCLIVSKCLPFDSMQQGAMLHAEVRAPCNHYTKQPFPESHAGEQYTVFSCRSLCLSLSLSFSQGFTGRLLVVGHKHSYHQLFSPIRFIGDLFAAPRCHPCCLLPGRSDRPQHLVHSVELPCTLG